ncbi:hypothetical protein [Pseudomonas duriflava]|uniref:hypothetical protein n=1 Tax=Pseudomonas duriflava TaxID=459528 RepID=UPI001FCAE820|nr:hypothetical protein [Pseudomonas duriflava]
MSELYLTVCMGFSFLFLLGTVNARNKQDYNLVMGLGLFSTFIFMFLPALFADLFYGQPLVYGLIEERRVLFCFSFVLLLYMGKRVGASEFEKTILAVGLLAVALSWLSYFDILPDLRDRTDMDLSRPDRASVGATVLIISYCLCIYFWGKGKSPLDGQPRHKMNYLILAALYFATLVFVTQTRQVLLVCAIFTLLCLKQKSIIFVALGLLIITPFMINPHLLEALGVNVDFYMQSAQEGATDNVRESTIAQIFDHLSRYNWEPSGSLSLMWNNGFKSYFSYYFFLSDVGVIGTLFRFGFLAPAVITVTLFLYAKIAKKLNANLDFTLALFLAYLTIWPLQGLFEYQEGLTAFLFVIQALKTFYQSSTAMVLPSPVEEKSAALMS